jgi:putative SOS response-associated peptidase YedK
MCNLYRMMKSTQEVAQLFRVVSEPGANFAAVVYPGYSGLVIANGKARTMTWGFPLVMKSKKTGAPLKPKPVNNARGDKLNTAFWRDSFVKRRCLIPVTAWAEAEGPKGSMTRTWHALEGHELFAVAGVWRPTAEWGDSYSMVMVDGCDQMAAIHDRMPTILREDQWDQWAAGTLEEAMQLCRTCVDPLTIERSPEPWFQAKSPAALSAGSLL